MKIFNATRNWDFTEADFPEVPADFTPRTPTEVLALDVKLPTLGRVSGLQRTFDELWDLAVSPQDYTKWRWDELKSDAKHLRLVGDRQWLAGTEVLSAALLFPR